MKLSINSPDLQTYPLISKPKSCCVRPTSNQDDETIQAGKFKAECLKHMERVKKTRRKIVITKRNIPIAKLVPIDAEDEKVFGWLKGTVHFKQDDIVEPIAEDWDADS